MAKTQEQKGNFADPLEWASKNFDKLKTVRVGNTNVTPKMMVRDKKRKVIKQILESEKKALIINLGYRDYVLFHRMCYQNGLSPTKFIQKLNASFETEHEGVCDWLEEIKESIGIEKKTMPLTENELYDMLEEQQRGANEKPKETSR